jgi:DNA-directed RNA polymerase specialized sigma24 family protein
LFDFERMHSGDKTTIAITRQQRQVAEDRRRDIYDSHRHRIFALSYYMTGNEIEAEKILTTTFISAFSATAEPSAQEVDSALVSELRERFPLGAQDAPVSPEPAAADLSQGNVRRTDLEEGIQTLPPQERLLFLLRDVEGYTPAAIAQLLQMPESAVNRSLLFARLRLRQALAENQTRRQEAA